ncbi:MAG: sigma-70 family RNA polymerase sigma factor [Thermaerobacter sp.]|nr:sigma-70 family RNA polymerase sigma factor [Thermaerobacter sp.]
MQMYGDRALRYAYVSLRSRADAEDAAQEAFVRLWRHCGRRGVQTLTPALLFHTVTNLCRDRLRYLKRHPEDPTDWLEMTAGHLDEPDLPHDMAVWDAVQGLAVAERQCVMLFYYMDRSLKETAAALGVNEQVVKTRLYRARQHLKPILEPAWKENLV